MIGMSRNNLLCPIELLDKHAADQHVWPGKATKGNREVGALAYGIIEPVGPSYENA